MSFPFSTRCRSPSNIALKDLDEFGGPKSHLLYTNGWAFAGATPFAWGHQVASAGGVCQPMVVHWPKGIKEKGGLRTQWHHMIDIAPTVLEAVGVPAPGVVHGVPQKPMEGVSMLYTFNDAEGEVAPPHPVLRDGRQPGHLPGRLVRNHGPPAAVGEQAAGYVC